jgi:hypothetical protein
MAIEFLSDLWAWFSADLMGSMLVAVAIVFLILFGLLYSLNIPNKITIAFLIPIAIGLIGMGLMSWFGYIIILLAGITFGLLVYMIWVR